MTFIIAYFAAMLALGCIILGYGLVRFARRRIANSSMYIGG